MSRSRQKDLTLAAEDREQSRKLSEAYLQQINAWIPLQARLSLFGDLLARTTQEAERRRANLSLAERAIKLAAVIAESLRQLAGFEIYSVTDTITVEGEEISGTRRVTLGEMLTVSADHYRRLLADRTRRSHQPAWSQFSVKDERG